MSGDPLYYFVRDKGSPVAHHWDYVRSRADHALCGHPYQAPVWEGEDRPRAVCRACQALLPPHEARWWRTRAEALQKESESMRLEAEGLRTRLAELERQVAIQRSQLRQLNAKLGGQARGRGGGSHAAAGVMSKRTAKPGAKKKAKRTRKPDNSREAVNSRLREESGLMSAANISSGWKGPTGRSVRVVSGGLPGLGKRR